MSDGSKSGVNCTRRHDPPVDRAMAFASEVLPTPGTSSIKRWPSENKHTSDRCTARRFPRSTRSICVARASNRSLNDCSGRGAACTVVDLRRGRPGPRCPVSSPETPDRRHATVSAVGVNRGDQVMTHGAAFWFRCSRAVLLRPHLWFAAIRQVRRAIPTRWWARRPFVPVPDMNYARFRLETAYGAGTRPRRWTMWSAISNGVAPRARCHPVHSPKSRPPGR